MICINCGADLPEGAHFCSACGAPVPVLPELVPDPEPPKAAPLSDLPEPVAPMYTEPEPVEPAPAYTEPEPVEPAPVYAEPVPMPAQSEVDSCLNWGIAGLVCAFFISILGIIFSAIAMNKAKRIRSAYGFLPQQAKTGRGLGIAGLIVSIVFTVLGILFLLIIVAALAYAVNSGASFYYY